MDGYHFYRKDLDENGIRYRGAPFTIDLNRLKDDIVAVRRDRKGKFPTFAHEKKDPVENAIIVDESTKYIILEGLYIFMEGIDRLIDLKVFIDCPEEIVRDRLIHRHVSSGICTSIDEAK